MSPVANKITEKRLKCYIWAYEEEGRRAHMKNDVICADTRTETERKTGNQVERLVE